MAINPVALLMNGIADLVGQFKIPPKYWDCARADYVSLPFVTQGDCPDACITPEGWAFVVGLWDGLVGEVKGVPEGIGAIAKDPVAVAQAIGKLVTLDGPTWTAIKEKIAQEHSEAAGKPCQISHLVATDIVAVASFVLPLTKLSKAKIATSITNLADNTLLTLTKFKVAGRVGFEVLATTGKSTFEIIQDAGTLTLKVADAAIYWSVGQANRVFFGKSWALATDAGGYILRAGDGEILKATELMRDANGILLKMEKTIAGKKEEVLALVLKGAGSLDFVAMDLPKALQHVKFRDLSNLARRDIVGLHDAIEFYKLRITSAIGNRNFQFPIGKTLDEVDEIVILAEKTHPTIPGVKTIEYRVPSTDGKLTQKINGVDVNKGYTTGGTKGVNSTEDYVKTIYDPTVWPDAKLEKALKEALQDAATKNGGNVPYKFNGITSEGYKIEGYFKDGKVSTFYFEVN